MNNYSTVEIPWDHTIIIQYPDLECIHCLKLFEGVGETRMKAMESMILYLGSTDDHS